MAPAVSANVAITPPCTTLWIWRWCSFTVIPRTAPPSYSLSTSRPIRTLKLLILSRLCAYANNSVFNSILPSLPLPKIPPRTASDSTNPADPFDVTLSASPRLIQHPIAQFAARAKAAILAATRSAGMLASLRTWKTRNYAYWHHLLPHLRRLRRRCHRAWPGIGRPRTRRSFHQLRPTHPDEPERPAYFLPRSRSRFLPALRPPALRPGSRYQNARGIRSRIARPAPRPLRHPALGQRLTCALDGGPAPLAVHHHASRHGHHAGRQQPLLSADYQVFHRTKRWRHCHLAVSLEPDPQGIRHPATHRSHSELRQLRPLYPPAESRAARQMGAGR